MKLRIVCRLLLWVVCFYPFFGLVAVSAFFEIHVRTVLGIVGVFLKPHNRSCRLYGLA